jgi:phage host-nuclease inhibitor protein Gam
MTSLRRAGRIFKEKKDVNLVKSQIEELTREIQNLERTLNEEIEKISQKFNIDNYKIETLSLQPKRTDITNVKVDLLWEA